MPVRLVREHFDELFFTESTFEAPHIAGTRLTIPIRNAFAVEGYPMGEVFAGRLVFNGVASSHRTATEYIGEPHRPDGFQPPRRVEDHLPEFPDGGEFRDYAFEAMQATPPAWIDDWIIRAASFEFEIDEVRLAADVLKPR